MQPLAGGLLNFPWNIYNVDTPSCAQDDKKDVLDLRRYMFINDIVRRGFDPKLQDYSEPILATAGWLKGLDKVYSHICITAGYEECPWIKPRKRGTSSLLLCRTQSWRLSQGRRMGRCSIGLQRRKAELGKICNEGRRSWERLGKTIAFSSKSVAWCYRSLSLASPLFLL